MAEKPTYRSAFKKKRCLVVEDGYDEWKVIGGPRKTRSSSGITCTSRTIGSSPSPGCGSDGERDSQPCESATIIITSANAELSNIHDRMPVILHRQDYSLWLGPAFEGKEKLLGLLQPYPVDELVATALFRTTEQGRQ